MKERFIDYSLFNIVNSIISQNNELDKIVEELLVIILNKFKAKHVGIYIKHKFKNELIKFNKAISQKGEEVSTILVKSTLNSVSKSRVIQKTNTGYIIPLFFGDVSVGVLHMTFRKNRINFSENETLFIKDLATHLAQLFISLGSVDNITFDKSKSNKKIIKGVGVYKGIAWGKIFKLKNKQEIEIKRKREDFESVEAEFNIIEEAVIKTIAQINTIEAEIRDSAGEDLANIFVFHQTILSDKSLLVDIKKILEVERICAQYAVVDYFDEMKKKFIDVNDHIIVDITDIEIQILNFIQNKGYSEAFSLPEEDFILVSEQILPSDIIKSKSIHFKGMIEAGGGQTSHASILAKSLNIPLIYGVGKRVNDLVKNDYVVLDSGSGIIINNPSETIVDEYKLLEKEAQKVKRSLIAGLKKETSTLDGVSIKIGANIGVLSELPYVEEYKSEYIGLYRTEMPFLIRQNFPTEERQYEIYKKVISNSEISTTIRTLDIGGDKAPKYLNTSLESNPVLGKRSIRIMFDLHDEFKSQIKAIYRAAVHGSTKVMFPMVSSIEEIEKLKDIVAESLNELDEKGIEYARNVEFGVMIEVPAAVWIIDEILEIVDFVSVGTNDLIQYTLAVDRDNSEVFYLFKPFHPSILRTLNTISKSCKNHNKEVYVCGEMAGDLVSAAVLIGLGVTNLSMSVHAIPLAKEFVEKINYNEMKKIADTILKMKTSNEIEEYVLEKLSELL